MLYGLLLTLFIIISILLILIIMIQQTKGSMGLGNLGGGAQMLFGGSGGQDIFQKITWFLGASFMIGSFALTLMRAKESHTSKYLTPAPVTIRKEAMKQQQATQQTAPQEIPQDATSTSLPEEIK